MKKTVLSIIVVAAITMMFGSCSSTKDIAYFKNSDTVSLEASKVLYDARIMPKDILTITVSTTEDEAAKPFNLTVPTAMNSSANRSLTNQPVLQNYLVDNEGYIDFPRIGRVKLLGMTKSQAEEAVGVANYKCWVLGEVNRPGMYTVSNEKICILEALAQAGDMTIYGVRNNVKLIREDENGQKSIHILNLNDANLINSPYYYLQQNDVVIVQPNKVKAQNSSVGSMTTLWFSATSILISLTSLLYNILK